MKPSQTNNPRETSPRRRRWRYLLYVVVLASTAIAAFVYWQIKSANATLDQAIAATNAIDPHWRMSDLLANSGKIPDSENAALIVLAGHQLLNFKKAPPQPDSQPFDELDGAMEYPPYRLNDLQKDALKQMLPQYEKSLPEYLKVGDMPSGKYPFTWTPTAMSSQYPAPIIRTAGAALRYDVIDRLEAGDVEGACRSILVTLGVARSTGDEPFAVTLITRCAVRAMAVNGCERVLAQCETTPEMLAELQKRMEQEANVQMLPMLIRGERAHGFEIFETMYAPRGPATTGINSAIDSFQSFWADVTFIRREKTRYLIAMNQLAEVVKLPSDKIADAIDAMDRDLRQKRSLAALTTSSLAVTTKSIHISLARLRCTAAALAAERFRQRHNRWPDSLDDLVADKLVAAIPLDAFDGQPLRWKTVDDGRLIYSVGPDRTDNNGVENRNDIKKPGSDIVFRLYDPAKRRQPPRIVEKKVGTNQ